MENNTTPKQEFENFMRRHLGEIDDTPDTRLWDNIAAEQGKRNVWLKWRHYGWYAGGALAFALSVAAIWWSQRPEQTIDAAPEAPSAVPTEMTAAPPPAATIDSVVVSLEQVSTKTQAPKLDYLPQFSPRHNAVPGTAIRFVGAEGIRYQNPATGTTLRIPANSLIDAQGRPVPGEVDLFFREYRGIADYLASGLPMHYSDARGDFFFNSGGMFEVRVSQNGEPLQMASGRSFDLQFSPTSQLEKASLYYLEDSNGKWQFLPDAAFGQAGLQAPPIATENEAVQGAGRRADGDCLPEPYEVTGVGETLNLGIPEVKKSPLVSYGQMVQIGIQTGFELATGKRAMPRWFLKNPFLTDEQLLFRMEKGTVQMKKHRDKAQLFFPEDLDKYFTELDAFKNCYFSFNTDSMGGGRRNKRLVIDNEYWQRIVVEHVKNAECIVTVYDGQEGQMQFHAMLRGNTENKHFDPLKVMAEYERLRKKRQQDFAEQNRALRFFLQAAAAFKSREEWCMSSFEWLDYFEKNHTLMAARYQQLIDAGYLQQESLADQAWRQWRQKLREQKFNRPRPSIASASLNLAYSLSLYRFGIYNCDQIFRLSAGQKLEYVMASYKTPDGARVAPASIAVMDRNAKLFFTQPFAHKLISVPGRQLDIILTDRNGRQYYLPAGQYAQQKWYQGAVNSLTVRDVTDQTSTPEEWASLLDI